MKRVLGALAATWWFAGCGGDDGGQPIDAAIVDGAVADAATDAAAIDAAAPDAAVDAAMIDAATLDAAMIDAAIVDAATIDAVPIDAVPIDAVPIDAAIDAPACTDQCTAGVATCTDPATTRTCGNFDADPCLELSPATACGAAQYCTAGAGCVAGFVLRLNVTGGGSVALSAGSPSPCSGTCIYGFPPATTTVLTATPGALAYFAGWTGGCSGTGPCSVSAAATVGAPFPPTCTQTVVDSSSNGGTQQIAADATDVYWTNFQGNVVKRAAKSGGAATIVASPNRPTGITVDATDVYWASYASDTIYRWPKTGGTPTMIATAQDGAGSMANDATHVYWINILAGTIVRVPKSGGAPVTIVNGEAFGALIPGRDLAVDATSIYWVNRDAGAVRRVPLAGGTVTTLATGQTGPTAIVLGATDVYWTNNDSNTIMRVPKTGGAPALVATGGTQLSGLALDGAYLYYVHFGINQGLWRVLASGGTPQQLLGGHSGGWDLVVDASAVYFTENLSFSDAVTKVPRSTTCAP